MNRGGAQLCLGFPACVSPFLCLMQFCVMLICLVTTLLMTIWAMHGLCDALVGRAYLECASTLACLPHMLLGLVAGSPGCNPGRRLGPETPAPRVGNR